MRIRRSRCVRAFAVTLALLGLTAACSSDDDPALDVATGTRSSTTAPATTTTTSPVDEDEATAASPSAPTTVAAGVSSTTSPPATTGPPTTASPRTTARPATTTTTAAPATTTTTTTSPPPAPEAALRIANFTFSPPVLRVPVGAVVTATNEDGATHTWTADDGSWDSGNLATGATHRQRFSSSGTFSYHCSIHPSMKGTVDVS